MNLWKLHMIWNRFWYRYPKCTVCGHPLFDHVLYDEAPSRLGVCIKPCCIDADLSGVTQCDSFNMPKVKQYCTRCGSPADRLYDYNFTDEDTGEEVNHKLCWNCDHDVMNGGDIYDDAIDVLSARAENAYEYDPINNPRPY